MFLYIVCYSSCYFYVLKYRILCMSSLKNIKDRGQFIVIYASNNLGKSEQAKRLASNFIMEGKQVLVIKYPIYELAPTGPMINKILRNPEELGREVSELELQTHFAQNRRDFQQTLVNILNAGIPIIAEDYTGTGIAWGMTRGIDIETLEELNKDLLIPDISILLDGDRFTTSIEKKHRNESESSSIWNKNRQIHLRLAERYGWKVIHANQSVDNVGKDVARVINENSEEHNLQTKICVINELARVEV